MTAHEYARPDAHVHLGVFYPAIGAVDWAAPDAGDQVAFSSYARMAQTAERGLFDAFFVGDGQRVREHLDGFNTHDVSGRPDALTVLSAVAAVTERIGLVATQNATYNDAADLAHRLSTLDALSGGRAAWNIVTTDNAWTGENFRRGGFLPHDQRYVHATAQVAAILDAWDVDPLLPSPQGRPVLFQAGDSGEGRDLAARYADVIFSAHPQVDDALDFATDLRSRLVARGRAADDILFLPGATVVVAETTADAHEKAQVARARQVTPRAALAFIERGWGRDLSEYDVDGPLPDIDPVIDEISVIGGNVGHKLTPQQLVAGWRELADAKGYSIRDLALHHISDRGFVGSAAEVADRLAHAVRSGAFDGLNLLPARVPDGLDDVVDLLVPALQDRGVYRTEYTGTTLRDHLGLRPL